MGGKCRPLGHPCMLALGYPGEIPLRSTSLFWDVLRWSSSSHTEAGVEVHLRREAPARHFARLFPAGSASPQLETWGPMQDCRRRGGRR